MVKDLDTDEAEAESKVITSSTAKDLDKRIRRLRKRVKRIAVEDTKPLQAGRYANPAADFAYSKYSIPTAKPEEIKPKPIDPLEMVEAQKRLGEAKQRLQLAEAMDDSNIYVETCKIQIEAAVDALSEGNYKKSKDISEHVLQSFDDKFVQQVHDETAKGISNAYSLISSAKLLDVDVTKENKRLEDAQNAFIEDDYALANNIINEVTNSVKQTKKNVLTQKVRKTLEQVEEVLGVVKVLKSEEKELREVFENAQSLYSRGNLDEAYKLSNKANDISKTLKDLYFQKYCLDALAEFQSKINVADSLLIDTSSERKTMENMKKLSSVNVDIVKIKEVAGKIESLRTELSSKINEKLRLSVLNELHKLETDIEKAKNLNQSVIELEVLLRKAQESIKKNDFSEFEDIKTNIKAELEVILQSGNQKYSKKALMLVGEVRTLIKENQGRNLDVNEAQWHFDEAKKLVSKGEYREIINHCNKAKNIIAQRNIEAFGPTTKYKRILFDSDERLSRVGDIEDIQSQLVDLRKSGVDTEPMKRRLEEAAGFLEEGDFDRVDTCINQISVQFRKLNNEVWVQQATLHLERMGTIIRDETQDEKKKKFYSKLYTQAMYHIEKREFMDAIHIMRTPEREAKWDI